VVHRSIRHVAAEQPRDLRLELEHHLQRALRDFRLIGRVGGEELAALDDMIDARRHVMAIGAGAEEEGRRPRRQVLRRQPGHVAFDGKFAGMHRQAGDRAVEHRAGGHIGEEVVDRPGADDAEHRLAIGLGKGQVAHSTLLHPS
ncbi:hypothetical protein QU38_01365, partial [Staphylococcus aureus]